VFDRELSPHPNVVQVYGISIDGPQPILVLEYCPGGTKSFYLETINSFSFLIFDD
jgi:serine/threonine protein kinase